ncbi:MAG: TolC family protein [Pseudomonadota bacterium]|nr:TolC family protein [Pseudomonadota bacterium]
MLIIILRPVSSYSLSINELMIITNENSLIIQADLEYLKKFQNDIELAKKMNDPTITLSGFVGAKHQETDSSEASFNPRNLNLTMSKNLFDGYKTKYSIIQANDLSLQADYLFEALKQNVYLESISSYLDLIHLRQSYDLTEQSLMLTKNNLDFKVQQHNSGDISDIDLEKAKLEYSKYEFSLKKIQISISDQEDLILDYMSTIPSTNKYPELMDRGLDLSSESLIEFAVNNNPTIKSSQIYLKILEHSKLIERSANLPKVDLEVGFNRNWDATDSAGQADEYSIIGSISIPLYESEEVNIKESNIDLDIIRNDKILKDQINTLKREINSLLDQIEMLNTEYEIENNQKEIYEKDIEIKKESYNVGSSSQLDIYDSQIKYNEHLISMAQIMNSRQKAHYLLLNKIGKLTQ